jgi:hypothetical protein
MTAVLEFGRTLTKPLGAPAGTVETYIEVPFLLNDRKFFPDGLIRVSRGKRVWTALVEVKTGSNNLNAEQLENYLDIARENEFDAVLTISNEIPPVADQHPTKVDRRKLRRVSLHHLPWTQILAEAVMQKEFRGVADPDQAWILGELIRYLEHPRSGALEFDDMGEAWVAVRNAVNSGTLRATDRGVEEVAARFDALLRFASLHLGRQLGAEVTSALTRRELADPAVRNQALVARLVDEGLLVGSIRIPDTVGPLVVAADLHAGRVSCHVDIDAPREGRPTTRVNWLLRQLKNAPDTLRVEAFAARARGAGAAELLGDLRDDPRALVVDPTKELRSFRLVMTTPLGTRRGRGRGAFIDSVLAGIDQFYTDVMQNLKAWAASPPRLRQEEPAEDLRDESVPAALISTALSSQDGALHESALEPGQPQADRDADEQHRDEQPKGGQQPAGALPGAANGVAERRQGYHQDAAADVDQPQQAGERAGHHGGVAEVPQGHLGGDQPA